ncbi:hypothetical protein KC340_g5518 [Hortaea werneckii]|nr:hypothetical protein KC339_g7571 [Hortaea werneckii]KAI7242549.1 hypothetical protein KC365_g3066 [Hortaea werneckii]KAI7327647.1 hypothetical protein KC340_g5518 [Hortaea werneckii]
MAPEREPPSPSPSTAFLPFLGTRSRRGSLASINSRRDVDKDVLAQALDQIHGSASRSETLTSFHDFDGGGRGGAKEMVSNGMSGLYNRLRQSVGVSTPGKRPNSRESKDSIETQSVQSFNSASRNVPALTLKKPPADAASVSTASVAASPVLTSFAGTGPVSELKQHALNDKQQAAEPRKSLEQDEDISVKDHASFQEEGERKRSTLSQDDVDRARIALMEDDRSETATQALARVLSHHEIPLNERSSSKTQQRTVQIGEERSSLASDRSFPETSARSQSVPQTTPETRESRSPSTHKPKPSESVKSPPGSQRHSLVNIGVSRLPGFEPSRASSTTEGGEVSSSSTTQNVQKKPALEPSPNINSGLQRARADSKPPPSSPGALRSAHVPTHLKRRVLSKEFWMRDENAKDCFYCGQTFSTFRRKHHCRTCGQIFDAKCTTLVPGRPFGQPGTIRLCKPCEAMIYGSDDDSTVFSDDGDDSMRSPQAIRDEVGGSEHPGRFDGSGFSRPGTGDISTPSMGIPASRRNREAKRRSAVIEFDAAPTLARPSSSHSLISLSRRPRSSSHRRHGSRFQNSRGPRSSMDERGPFQQDLARDPARKSSLPAFHNDNIIDPDLAPFLSDDESDEDEQPNILSALDQTSSPGERERLGFGSLFASAMKRSRTKHGDKGTVASSVRGVKEDDALSLSTRHLPKLSRKRHPSMSSVNIGRPSPRRSKSNVLLKTVESEPFDHGPSTPLPQDAPGSKVIRSSSMHGAEAPPVELNHASLEHVRRLLLQMLRDNQIDGASAWQKALVPILLQCTDDIKLDVDRGDDMDIRHYVKLKKVPGGRPGDTSYVSGVVFSKNVALKSMARSIRNPRVAIVTFAIEYARHQTHFMSLEPVIAQEREYLHNLVGRIAALKPQVLLVQRNVSGLALKLLEQAGITVACNIKESVLAAVARVTQTPMIKSVDKLAIDASALGGCASFEVKTYMHQGARKTYIFLSGCEPDLGCTIVLRGADTKHLRNIKRITEFLCYVVYNLKLETTLLRDEFVAIPSSTRDQLIAHEGINRHRDTPKALVPHLIKAQSDRETPSKYEELEEECRSRILSASPFVVFMQPYLLTQLREQERKLSTYKQLRDQYAAADDEGNEEKSEMSERFALVKVEMVNAPASKDQPKAVREYLRAVHQAQFEKTMHTYETQKRLWESFMACNDNPFDPLSHQEIAVLHSNVSSITSAPCSGPQIMGLGFYAGYDRADPQFEEDCTLGQYVESQFTGALTPCRECGKRQYDHQHQYVHGFGQVSISVHRHDAKLPGVEHQILMWSVCRICRAETPVVYMSDDTWKYSFAKYLELSFWSSPLRPRAGICEHDIHKDFVRCFGLHKLVLRVQYDPIDIYDVVVPRSTVTWKVEADLLVKNEQYSHFLNRLNSFTDSIVKRLDSINVDTLEEKMAMEAHEKIDELRQQAKEDHEELLEKLQQKYGSSRYYEVIPLNRALRYMDEKAIAWDEEFNNFERDFFPSETDIRKLATLQLKNMFLESQPSSSSIASDISDTEDGTEMKSMATKSPKKLRAQELQSEKAHDVMSSTIEEHRNSRDISAELEAVANQENAEALGSSLGKRFSPREEKEAVASENMKHLDLAVTHRSPEDATDDQEREADEPSQQTDQAPASEENEPFATQPKPLSSGLLERIEQIRNNRALAGSDAPEPPHSKIPRLVDRPKRDVSPAGTPPPLVRAQSQPAHLSRKSAELKPENIAEAVTNGQPQPSPEIAPLDKRLGERLGVGRLVNKSGRLTPSLIPRSIPQRSEESTSTSVSALAKHFEQMSREFEKERLRERRQRAMRSRQARANPLASSRPVVEVYRNATEAVGEKTMEQAMQDSLESDEPAEPVEPLAHTESAPPAQTEVHQVSDETPTAQTQEIESSDESAEQPHRETMGESNETLDVSHTRPRDISDVGSTSTLVSPTAAPEMELSIPDHRKNVWFKYLADFWSKRSASGWANLEYPLHPTEHVFEDSDIIVREDEPSSVIALSLNCVDYLNKVTDFRSHPNKQGRKHAHTASQTSNGYAAETDEQQKAIEASLLSDTGTHMKYSFAHGPVKASCKIFYAESFDALRRRCGVAERFVESMSRCLKFDSKGGKTKSLFLRTLDQRFIIKSLQEVELKAFTKFAPDYFAFMSYTLFHGVPSVIAKMLGLFQVTIKNPQTGVDFSYYLLVMENLFYERNPNRRFDLKGSMRNRKIESTGQPDEVLLDENLVETIFEKPLFVREHARKLMQASVWNDTMWLCKQNVMDYSLMAGFDDEKKEIIVGIIDCIRTYTWDKKLESWIKDRGKNKPTITSPKDYRNRFRVSMMQYVLSAPSPWHQFQVAMIPPKTLKEEREAPLPEDDVERQASRLRSEGM